MFRKSKELLWTFVGFILFGLFVFGLSWINRPEKIVIEFEESAKSDEHEFIGEVLLEPEAQAEKENIAVSQTGSDISSNATGNSLPVDLPLAKKWESRPAPEADEVELSESFQRSLANSAPLATEEFLDIQSDLNNSTIGALQALSIQRSKKDTE